MKNTNEQKTAYCANCGKRHKILPAYVGYPKDALCSKCNKEERSQGAE